MVAKNNKKIQYLKKIILTFSSQNVISSFATFLKTLSFTFSKKLNLPFSCFARKQKVAKQEFLTLKVRFESIFYVSGI